MWARLTPTTKRSGAAFSPKCPQFSLCPVKMPGSHPTAYCQPSLSPQSLVLPGPPLRSSIRLVLFSQSPRAGNLHDLRHCRVCTAQSIDSLLCLTVEDKVTSANSETTLHCPIHSPRSADDDDSLPNNPSVAFEAFLVTSNDGTTFNSFDGLPSLQAD
jgi:hypothetical protein